MAVTSASGFAPGSVVRLASRGHVVGAAAAGTVADGTGIVIKADGAAAGEPVTFHSADFQDPAAATAADIAAAVNRQARTVTAEVTGDKRLVLLSLREGSSSSVAVEAPTAGTRTPGRFSAWTPPPRRTGWRRSGH